MNKQPAHYDENGFLKPNRNELWLTFKGRFVWDPEMSRRFPHLKGRQRLADHVWDSTGKPRTIINHRKRRNLNDRLDKT